MGYKDVRKGNTQAQFNDSAANFLFGECFVVAIIAGLATFNWAVFGLVLLALLVTTWFRKGAIILTIIFSICWTLIGFAIGAALGGPIAGIVFAIIALLVSAGTHIGAIEWMDDMASREKNESH
ncbi:hypothetical protein E2L07_05565 [Halalkalibacterium halodurans]|uniref:hypothetical protein n=1 Tax=Halalkalibacterium halodurans TaxID=86665 RepID=UPI001067EACB|nr:hypothetical protein [Halalkalibacterium halodurans]TES56155.1 hypothetical protein E2L07_05565 [Halalkalibacterium halodurans]